MKLWSMAALAALVVVSPAEAKPDISFAAWEGGHEVIQGTGGTRITEHGVDYWTTGDPPRPFHFLGAMKVVTSGEPFGRRAVAAAIKKAGGDAAVLKASSTRSAGSHGMATAIPLGNGVTIPAWSRNDEYTFTTFAVIKYAD